jgi:hypothetical protein
MEDTDMGYHDWLPGKRNEQFEMARTWLVQLPKANGAWTVTTAEIDELEHLIEAVQGGMYDLEKRTVNKESKRTVKIQLVTSLCSLLIVICYLLFVLCTISFTQYPKCHIIRYAEL